MNPLRVGVVGCGNISNIYLTNLLKFEETTVTAVADIDGERAKAKGDEFKVSALSVDEILTSSDVDLILNLTVPKAHFDVARRALEAGKHAYNEKPLALEREEGRTLVELAKAKNLRLGCAPDTFLGGGIQTCIGMIDSGAIGKVVSAQAFMMGHGVEAWHPSPHFFYQKGGGPMFDMGPYYLTALVTLIGGIERVTGVAKKTFDTRTVTSEAHKGDIIEVEIPTHVTGILEFKNGAVANLTTSFDVWHHTLPPITIHGTEGSLRVGDPNQFGDVIHLRKSGDPDWVVVEPTHTYTENSRGVGVLDIAFAIQNSRPHRASGDLAFHVLDTMHAIHESSDQGRRLDLQSAVDRPAALPSDGLRS
jgi:predicted dehydrogenase